MYEKWSDYKKTIFTEEEIAEADRKADLICAMIEARKEKGLSQRDLESITGIKQPVIARIERGTNYPKYETLLKILHAPGKTLAVVDIKKTKTV